MAYTFKLSDSSVNDYGTRVLTAGIVLDRFLKNPVMLWMHLRDDGGFFGNSDAPLPIGRWDNVRLEGDDLLADAVFDENDEFALQIKDKVDQKIINAASVGLSILTISEDPADMLAGQVRGTITKSELVEASIVDIPGNKNSVRLYNKGAELKLSLHGDKASLPLINLKQNTMKKIVLTTLAAVAAFFNLKTSDEKEISQEDMQKLNDELQARADSIATLTSERDTLKNEATTSAGIQAKTESDLTAANNKVTALETENTNLKAENTQLKANAGADPAAAATAAVDPTKEVVDEDVKFCSSHTIAENVAYLKNKKK